jgi:hypothetical protein
MARKLRTGISVEGVTLTQSCWFDNGENFVFASLTSTSTATIDPLQIAPIATSAVDSKSDSSPIWRLQGAQIIFTGATAMVAQTTLNLGVVIYHTFGTLATQITNAGGAITSLTTTALTAPMPSGQTFTLVNAAGTVQTWTTSAAVLKGATTIPVTSTTPTGTNAVGNPLVGFLGGAATAGIQFGWLASGSGTPALYLNSPTVLPAINANILAGGGNTAGDPYGAFAYVYPGDLICLFASSAGSVTVQSGILSLLVA